MEISNDSKVITRIKEGENKIPGANVVGFGFDMSLGVERGKKLSIFDYTEQKINEYGREYIKPSNMNVQNNIISHTQIDFGETISELATKLSVKAGLSVNKGPFTLELSGKFNTSLNDSTKSDYFITEHKTDLWKISLNSYNNLNPIFKAELDSLPIEFELGTNSDKFFNFFRKWGTHFCSSASAGGSLELSIQSSSQSEETHETLQAQVKTSFKAFYLDASADAKTSWSKVSKTFFSETNIHFTAKGGNLALLSGNLEPTHGGNISDKVAQWKESLNQNPNVKVDHVEPIYRILESSGNAYKTLKNAFYAYSLSSIQIEFSMDYQNTFSSHSYKENYCPPTNPVSFATPTLYVRTAIVDRTTLSFLDHKVWIKDLSKDVTMGEGMNIRPWCAKMSNYEKAHKEVSDLYNEVADHLAIYTGSQKSNNYFIMLEIVTNCGNIQLGNTKPLCMVNGKLRQFFQLFEDDQQRNTGNTAVTGFNGNIFVNYSFNNSLKFIAIPNGENIYKVEHGYVSNPLKIDLFLDVNDHFCMYTK
jgi:hypothetical protein